MTNIAPDAVGVKSPEIIDNEGRVRVNTYETKYAVKEEKTQVGVVNQLNTMRAVNIDHQGQSEHVISASKVPLYGRRVVKVPIKNQMVSSKVMNTETGEEVPNPPEAKVTHGTDGSDDNNDLNAPIPPEV